MKLGIKVGPQKQSFLDLSATNPDCAEVWFNINDIYDYSELFDELKRHSIDVGLHFWGAINGNICTNISYPDSGLVNKTMRLIRQTIDIAAQNKFVYVNIHPGSRAICSIEFSKHEQHVLSDPVNLGTAEKLCLENARILDMYGKKRGVIFTVETVPPCVSPNWYDPAGRFTPLNIYEMPLSTLYLLAQHGIAIANDFGHTAANGITDNPMVIWELTRKTTQDLAYATKLIHIGYTLPPYSGTDVHDMLDNPLFETTQAVPNKKQLIELLTLFKNHEGWIIPEPIGDHQKNYFLAKELLKEVNKN